MPDEDASLADFVDDDDPDEDEPDRIQPDADEPDAGADPSDAPHVPVADDVDQADEDVDQAVGGVKPAAPTAAWAPDGACAACGATVERRFRDGEALVCADCKDW